MDTLILKKSPRGRELSPMEACYLRDLQTGRNFNMKASPYSVRQILERLISARTAEIYTIADSGATHTMVRISAYGQEVLK